MKSVLSEQAARLPEHVLLAYETGSYFMTVAIHIENLTRRFNDLVAVDNISFDIEQGEIFGLLGPNGAGKTTTLSMLSTMLKPTSGSATVNGIDIEHDEDGVRKSIGIVFQDQSLDEELTAWENMDFHGRLYRIPQTYADRGSPNSSLSLSWKTGKMILSRHFPGG